MMGPTSNDSETRTLTGEEAKLAGEISLKLSRALKGRRSISLKLSGSKHELRLPRAAVPLLIEILDQMSKGRTVKALATDAEVSTQRAANLLHVSRPFLIELLEKKEIPFRRVGSHRRIRLSDVLAYKRRIDEQRMAALDELARMSQELGLGYD
jgi:excisionase family DNA binding protein